MRIVEIEVEGLFGTFHHKIPLHLEDRITIIHGPNGFGKTVLLEMIHGLFEGDYEPIFRVPFSRLLVRFEDGNVLTLREKEEGEGEDLILVEWTRQTRTDSFLLFRAQTKAASIFAPRASSPTFGPGKSAGLRTWFLPDPRAQSSDGFGFQIATSSRCLRSRAGTVASAAGRPTGKRM